MKISKTRVNMPNSRRELQNKLEYSSINKNSILTAISMYVKAVLRCVGVGKIALARRDAPSYNQM
jgi:hypothetical protein